MADNATQLKPLGDRLVIKPAGREETTKSGIVLPDTAKEKPHAGKRIELDVKVGDEVLFAKYAGTEFKLEDEDLLILSEKDVLAVIG